MPGAFRLGEERVAKCAAKAGHFTVHTVSYGYPFEVTASVDSWRPARGTTVLELIAWCAVAPPPPLGKSLT